MPVRALLPRFGKAFENERVHNCGRLKPVSAETRDQIIGQNLPGLSPAELQALLRYCAAVLRQDPFDSEALGLVDRIEQEGARRLHAGVS